MKNGTINPSLLFLRAEGSCHTGGLGLTEVTHSLTNQELLIQFFDFLIAEVFLYEIAPKMIMVLG